MRLIRAVRRCGGEALLRLRAAAAASSGCAGRFCAQRQTVGRVIPELSVENPDAVPLLSTPWTLENPDPAPCSVGSIRSAPWEGGRGGQQVRRRHALPQRREERVIRRVWLRVPRHKPFAVYS